METFQMVDDRRPLDGFRLGRVGVVLSILGPLATIGRVVSIVALM